MKAKIPHKFYLYASRFTLDSMIKAISILAFDVFKNNTQEFGSFAKHQYYSNYVNGQLVKGKTMLVQTWLIDLVYDLIIYNTYGTQLMSNNEALYLISLHNDYANQRDKERNIKKSDVRLNLYGFFGEQKKFQNKERYLEDFAREKYILETISKRSHDKNIFDIDFISEFQAETGWNPDEYSAVLLTLWGYYSSFKPWINVSDLKIEFSNPNFTREKFVQIIEKYSITCDEIRKSKLQRQVLYTNPIIKLSDEYISANPFLLLCLFVNSNYWVMRNKYARIRSQHFINAFGIYFEMYVQEVFERCLNADEYERIPESDNEKRADWWLKLGGYNILIEQKSALSMLGIKQHQSDLTAMKEHITNKWGEAVRQLNVTEIAMGLSNAIKVILVYEEYYKCECLDELFKLDKSLTNDGRFWLVNIRELEMLLNAHRIAPDTCKEILDEKHIAEINRSKDGREIEQFLSLHGIINDQYLHDYCIYDQFSRVKSLLGTQ